MSEKRHVRQAAEDSSSEIRGYLGHLIESTAFRASARRRKLLGYIVDRALAGQSERLKAFDIALAVLGRDERFDPQNDPLVRIEVGRLRRDLDHYYEAEGRNDPIRISIPKGRYVPAFEMRDQPAPPVDAEAGRHPLRRFGWWRPGRCRQAILAAGAALVGMLVVVAIWLAWPEKRGPQAAGPAVIVVPFQPLAGGEAGRLLATGLTNDLVIGLMRFDGLQVFSAPPGASPTTLLPAAASGTPAYLVTGGVERASDRVRVTAALTDRASHQVLWSQRYDRALTPASVLDVEAEVTTAITSHLAQVYGVIGAATARQMAQSRPATMFAYDCVQRAFAYRLNSDLAAYPPTRACLEEAVRRDPDYAGAWAMLAFAYVDAAQFELVAPSARTAELDTALAAAERAVRLAPESVRSQQSLAAVLFTRGAYDAAERVQRQAIALNPHNPESLAQLGWRLLARGRGEEGAALLQEAIERSLAVPDWYHVTFALALYLADDLERARDEATFGTPLPNGYGPATLALTEAALGHATVARAALDEALRQNPALSQDPVGFWAKFQFAPEVIDRLNAGLMKAGLQSAGS